MAKTSTIRTICLSGLLLILANGFAMGLETGIIDNPQPTMAERRYVHLKLKKTILPDLGKDEYLFEPFSLAVDNSGNLFVYDIMQARIFKFDKKLSLVKAFGRQGDKAGEFSGVGRPHPVYITIGGDGLLYAADPRQKKIIVFDGEGEFTREIPLNRYIREHPAIDDTGALILPAVTRQRIDFVNEKKDILFSLPHEKGLFDYLFFKPQKIDALLEKDFSTFMNVSLLCAAVDSALLVYFQPSSTMYLVKDKTVVKKIHLRPKEAMDAHKKTLARELNAHPNIHRNLFSKLFTDQDKKDLYYLHMGRNMVKGINALYQFNLKGELLNVYYVRLDEHPAFTRFMLKQNGCFYAVAGDKVNVFTE